MFKEKLKQLREEKGLSQYELADKIFVSRSTVAKWENGLGMPGKDSMESLCEFFSVTKDQLLEEEDPIIVIDNLHKKSKKLLIIFMVILVPILLYCLAFTVAYCVEMYEDTITPQDGKYYSEKYLRKYDLDGLDMIQGENYQLFGSGFTSQIKSYDVFDDYVKYVYNRLQYSTTISYLSMDKKIYDPRDIYADLYLIPTGDLSEHIDKFDQYGRPVIYEFFYINNNTKVGITNYINCNYVRLSYSENNNSDTNTSESYFKMVISETESNDESIQKMYLINECFNVEKILLSEDNLKTYLGCEISEENDKIEFYPYGRFIMGGPNASAIPPFHLNIKVKFSLYDGDKIIKDIEKIDTLQYGKYISVKLEDFGIESLDGKNYCIKLDYEILGNSYYYNISKK